MKKRLVISMLRMSVVPLLVAWLAQEASASHISCIAPGGTNNHCGAGKYHCTQKVIISGTLKQVHSCNDTPLAGSEIFDMTLYGVSGKLIKAGLEAKCDVFGTVELNPDCTGEDCCDPTFAGDDDGLDPDCGIDGTAFCMNPAFNSSNSQGQPFTLEGSLSQTALFQSQDCTKSGKCELAEPITVNAALTDDICINPNWHFITFIASEFNGACCLCAFGFDDDGVCCADSGRTPVGDHSVCTNPIPGPQQHESCTDVLHCTVTLPPDYVPGESTVSYDCCFLSDVDSNGQCPSP